MNLVRLQGQAARFFACRDREILFEGTVGAAKTRTALEKLHYLAVNVPGFQALLLRKTRASLSATTMRIFDDHVLPRDHYLHGLARNSRQSYRYRNGSELHCGSLENWGRIMGGEYGHVLVDEATEIEEEDYEALLTRLRDPRTPFHNITCLCNPAWPGHWLNKRGERMTRFRGTMRDNPHYFDAARGEWTAAGAAYMATLAKMTGPHRRRLVEGEWAAAEGLVYEEFAPECVYDDADLAGAEWLLAVDFGYNDPFVCLSIALLGDTLFVDRELYQRRLTADEATAYVREEYRRLEAQTILADPESAQVAASWRDLGMRVDAPPKSVLWGIQQVKSRLPRGLRVRRSCAGLLGEFAAYSWADGQDAPAPGHDHALDCLRYACGWLSRRSRPVMVVSREPAADEDDDD